MKRNTTNAEVDQLQAFLAERQDWHLGLWRQAFTCFPVRVLINLTTGIYNIKDRNNCYIYADDIRNGEYSSIINAWATVLFPDVIAPFGDIFDIANLKQCVRDERRELRVSLPYKLNAAPNEKYTFLRITLTLPRLDEDFRLIFDFVLE